MHAKGLEYSLFKNLNEVETIIVVPGTGKKRFLRRFIGTLIIYRETPNSLILISGSDYEKEREIKNFVNHYISQGIPIIIERYSRTTYENAKNSSEFIKRIKPKNVIIVTDSAHITRTKLIFNKFLKNYEKVFYQVPYRSLKNLIKDLLFEIPLIPLYLAYQGIIEVFEEPFRRKRSQQISYLNPSYYE